jgi:Tol biopolymer transport system component
MTTFDRYDPFERRIGAAMDDIAGSRPLDYLDDVFRQTARTRQRPRWSFPERWLPMDTTLARPTAIGRRMPLRSLLLLVVLAAILASAAVFFGTQKRLPPPYGPANNGQVVFGMNGDLYVVDNLTSEPRLLLGGVGVQSGVAHSPDGQLLAYDNIADGADHVWVAERDGSNPRQVSDRPFSGLSFAWSPDSRSMALVTADSGPNELWIAPADGSGARMLDLEGIRPWEATWDPLRPGVLLVRAETRKTREVDLYYVDTTGTILSKIEMTGLMLNGAPWEFSGLAFSPDGQTIAYNSVEAQEPPVNRFRVHLMDRDGSNDRPIPAPIGTLYSQAWPIFSPDGKSIVMESWRSQQDASQPAAVNQLALAPSDGSAPAHWIGPSVPGQTLIKTWSPDGSRVLLSVRDKGELYSVDPVGGSFERLPWSSDLPDWQRVAR